MLNVFSFGLIGLIGCGEQGPQGDKGEKGEQGEIGENGLDGAVGENGQDGSNALISTADEPAGDNCEYGGTAISYGSDSNNNGVLDEDEVSNVAYICDGTDGQDGIDGTDGENGTNGTDGTSGSSRVVSYDIVCGKLNEQSSLSP